MPTRREGALRFGATRGVAPEEPADVKQQLTGGEGFGYVFEIVGCSATARTAYETSRCGGTSS